MKTQTSQKVLEQVRSALDGPCGVPDGARVLVAWSGGPDSTVLAWACLELAKRERIHPVLVHVHHGLRAQSDAEVQHVRRLATQMGSTVHIAYLHMQPGSGTQARARKLRYTTFQEIAAEQGCSHIFTGHTFDDQAETALMRVLRGTGIRGVRGVLRKGDDGRARPLLDVRREQIDAVLQELGVPAVRDPSNHDMRYLRTRIRHKTLPELESFEPGITNRLVALTQEAQQLWPRLSASIEDIQTNRPLSVHDLLNLPALTHGPLLERWLNTTVARQHVEAIVDFAARNPVPGSSISTAGAHTIFRLGEFLIAGPRSGEPDIAQQFEHLVPLGVERLKNCTPPARYLRSKWTAFSEGYNRRVSERFRKIGVPPMLRRHWPVLVDPSGRKKICGEPGVPFPEGMFNMYDMFLCH